MGFATRRPVLPAPTDSSALESAEDTGLGTDLATDISRRTDRTSHTIPDDGSPITVPTYTKRSTSGKLIKAHHQSQTSLLIEYYEGGKGPNSSSRQPSVRVRVTPSSSRKNQKDGHIVVSEAHGTRQTSHSRRISLGTDSPGRVVDPGSVSSLQSLEQAHGVERIPLDIEILQKEGSELSGISDSKEARFIVLPSDVSSIPPDTLPNGVSSLQLPAHHQQSRSTEKMAEVTSMHAPNATGERFSQKVIEKLSNKPRHTTTSRRRVSDKGRSRSASHEIQGLEDEEVRIKSSKRRGDDSTADSNVLTNSLLSAGKSGDQASFRSGTSQSSLNNPRLLQTVEDAIRRLILPELKELKKDQKNASKSAKYDREIDPSDLSGSSISREHVVRSYEEKGRRSSKDHGDVLSSGSKHRHRRRKDVDLDSQSDRSYRRRESAGSVSIEEDRDHDRKGTNHHRLRDAAAGAMVGGILTAEALKHHDSRSSLERDERRQRRRKRSKSRSSRSASLAESEEIFQKHDVPPMPMRSEVDSELTRSSLLSQKTAGTATPIHREVREVIRGSPLEISSPTSETPTMTPADRRRGLGTYHGNLSERDLSTHKEEVERDIDEEKYPHYGGTSYGGLAAGGMGLLAADQLLDDPERARKYESNLHHQHPIRRGLSPIQSVASYTTTEPNRTSVLLTRSIESLGSLKKKQQLHNEISIESLSSAPSTDLARSKRPQGISLENRSEVMGRHPGSPSGQTRDLDAEDFYDEQHSQNDRYRESYASSDPKIDARHMTKYTDDSMDAPYLDKVTAGQQVARGFGANPEYIHTPQGVESAVASLYDPSMVDVGGEHSPAHSYTDSMSRWEMESPRSVHRNYKDSGSGSPLKEQHLAYGEEDLSHRRGVNASSPPQSVARSTGDEEVAGVHMTESASKEHNLEGQDATSPESEITTNPSVIQGPIGGTKQGNLDHWPYNETPPRSRGNLVSPQGMSRDLTMADAQLYPDPLSTGAPQNKQDIYASNQIMSTPLGAKDEGYVTADNPKSPLYSPRPKERNANNFAPAEVDLDGFAEDDDPFTTNKGRYLSGMSQGMESPLYDSATGRGIERIQSKDIVALMDHLTVRDAQRNARDTEMLVTLVRSAAEMRNSFEDMKKFVAEQNDLVMDTADQQHEKTQKILGGPRPQPAAAARFTRSVASEDDETKRKSVFRRALQGLGSKNSRELQNIEQMLMQLLGDVEGLRSNQVAHPPIGNVPITSQHSMDNARAPTDPGYEPEGQAGTSSTGDRSGFFSNNSSRQADYRGAGGRRESGNRVSTVMEGDEEYEDDPNEPIVSHEPDGDAARFRSDNRDTYDSPQTTRGTSVPALTPPRPQPLNTGALSADNTPRMSNEGSGNRKHKSTASSFFPRISRWSKTTASSVADNFRSSGQTVNKPRPYSEVSHSGSNLDEYAYDHKGDDRLRSNNSLANEQYRDQENRPPSPLIPSQVSEKPKYQAHRNSFNLQHPQPRQGPTGRYQHHLETEAQNYGEDQFSPTSQTSSQWEQHGFPAMDENVNAQRRVAGQGHLSPISDGYSETSSAMMQQGRPASVHSGASADSYGKQGPPRPPKIRDDDPLVPQRPPKVAMTPQGSRQPTYVDHVAAARAGSPAFDKSPVAALRSSPGQARKPSGPRPIATSGQYTIGQKPVKKTRFRGSPNQIDSEEDVAY